MTVVYFCIDTTDLKGNVQIVSIGAITDDNVHFHRYINPTCDICPEATKIHGVKKIGGILHRNGWSKPKAVHPKIGLQLFVNWLSNQNVTYLVAHNNFGFHSTVLRNNLAFFGVVKPNFQIVDSYPIMQNVHIRFVGTLWPNPNSRSLDRCLKILCPQKRRAKRQSALSKAGDVKDICEKLANIQGFVSFFQWLLSHPWHIRQN